MKIRFSVIAITIVISLVLYSCDSSDSNSMANLKGRIISSVDSSSLNQVNIYISNTNITGISDTGGVFIMNSIPLGSSNTSVQIHFVKSGFQDMWQLADLNDKQTTDMGVIRMTP